MILDNQLMFSDGQDVTTTADSTNVVDMGVARDLGAGERLGLLLSFGTVVSNSTIVVTMTGADDAGISTNAVVLATSKTLTPTVNSQYVMQIPSGLPKRYYKLTYTQSGGSTPHVPVTATFVKDAEVKVHSRTL